MKASVICATSSRSESLYGGSLDEISLHGAGLDLSLGYTVGRERELKLFTQIPSSVGQMIARRSICDEITLGYTLGGDESSIRDLFFDRFKPRSFDGVHFSREALLLSEPDCARLKSGRKVSLVDFWSSAERKERGDSPCYTHHVRKDLCQALRDIEDPRERLPFIEGCLPSAVIGERCYTADDFTKPRFRSVQPIGYDSPRAYFVDLKGKREEDDRISRVEMTGNLLDSEYHHWMKQFTCGYVLKSRFFERGRIAGLEGPITVDIDILRAAGPDIFPRSAERTNSLAAERGIPEFAMLEIELPKDASSSQVITAIEKGHTNISCLKWGAINLCFRNSDSWDALSMQSLAAEGFEKRAQKVVKRLTRESQELYRELRERAA